ncbi:MAG: hypothetical protein AB7P31_01320 [Steroidobacteraceae bacterium]
MSARGIIRMGVAVLASAASLALSWPYWRDFGYWAESRTLWLGYFALGFVLAVYVFYAFLGRLQALFEHDALERAQRSQAPGAPSDPDREHTR